MDAIYILVKEIVIVIKSTPVVLIFVLLLLHLLLHQANPVEGLVVTVVPHRVVLMIALP